MLPILLKPQSLLLLEPAPVGDLTPWFPSDRLRRGQRLAAAAKLVSDVTRSLARGAPA